MSSTKERLDKVLVRRGLVSSRNRAAALIMAGSVRVAGHVALKAGMQVRSDVEVEIEQPLKYVGRGGLKLAHALETFSISVSGLVCADVGACTGGFTDALLQRGASKVYAIDVGYGHLAWKLRGDPRVVVMERSNARYLDTLPESIDFVSIDVSFISLRLILPVVKGWLSQDGEVVALIKPQFEAGPENVGKGGVVRDKAVHRNVLLRVISNATELDFAPAGLTQSPINGVRGNREFLLWLTKEYGSSLNISQAIEISLESSGKSET